MQIQLMHMQICPRARFALSHWIFVIAAKMTQHARGTAPSVNEPLAFRTK